MNDVNCARVRQAEAVEDGRLSAADRGSFERHALTCHFCTREIRALAGLRQAGERLRVPTTTTLERRRLRNEILRRANELAVRSSRSLPVHSIVVAFAVVAIAAALVIWLRAPILTSLISAPPHPHATASALGLVPALAAPPSTSASADVFAPAPAPVAPSFELTTSENAEWHTVERSATLRLSVQHGRFELHVQRLHAGQRFLLDLPDGELEVEGTRFVVSVDGVRTQSVRVLEGRVAVRLRNQSPVILGAGEAWPSAVVVTPSARTSVEAVTPAPAPPDAPAAASSVSPSNGVLTAGAEFAKAMSSFTVGNYAQAEQLFVAFEQHHPRDARVQDSTFLRAVARARRGDSSGAQLLAREYLHRYPKGLRRIEAERMAK